MSSRPLKIAIAKGSLFDGALSFLEDKDIKIENLKNRKLILKTNNSNFEILTVRGHDVPIYVEHGAADLGIVGYDVILDSQANVTQLEDLDYGHCRLCICAPKGQFKSISDLPSHTRVSTSFPNIAQKFFHEHGISVEVIKLYGSVELGPLTELSDVIVDLVATGKTLEENGLEVIGEIETCSARLIANNISYKLHKELISKLTNI